MSEEKQESGQVNTGATEAAPNQVTKTDNSKTCAVLAYLLVGIVWYFADEELKKSDLAKFHVKQSLNLLIISLVGSMALGLIIVIGWMLLPLFQLAVAVLAIIGIINAINSDKKLLPIVGQYADKYLKF